MEKVVPCLWFNGEAEDAVRFYVGLLSDSHIDNILRSPSDYPGGTEGSVLTVDFTLVGRRYVALNGGSECPFTEAVSFQIHCEDQNEVDRLWTAFTEGGGREVQCSWLKDRWGLSWQIVPRRLIELLHDPDRSRARRAMEAMMKMVKIDIAKLEEAAR